MSETRHVHVFEVNMNLIKKRSIRLYPKVGPVPKHHLLEQTCSTGLLEVIERIRCSADCRQEVVVRVVEVVDRDTEWSYLVRK
jgi:hypothetical protein